MPKLILFCAVLLTFAPVLARAADPSGLSFSVTTSDGADFDLAKKKGKVILIIFWASYSAPSLNYMDAASAAHRKYSDKGLEILGVNLDEHPDNMQTALDRYNM